jgi:fermentation-respiration switch protein FrsA (DUF1100 family)
VVRWIALALVAVVVLAAGGVFALGRWLSAPRPKDLGPPPEDLHAESVILPSESGSSLRAWFVPPLRFAMNATTNSSAPAANAIDEDGSSPRAAILLLHGIHASRRAMLPRARLLASAGYAVLLIDFQAHGESPGERITFGLLESRDVDAALAFLRARVPDRPLGAIGVSMGGAALVLAKRPLGLSAVVLESVYPTIEQAAAGRARALLGAPGEWISSLLVLPLRWRLGLDRDALRPIDHVASLDAPLLLLHGSADRATTLAEAGSLFAAAREPKQMHVFAGAGHVDLQAFAPADYARVVLRFLEANLRRE